MCTYVLDVSVDVSAADVSVDVSGIYRFPEVLFQCFAKTCERIRNPALPFCGHYRETTQDCFAPKMELFCMQPEKLKQTNF